ncbi:glycosyltransferase family 2 protein [Streptomyces sp. Q6]|uniref:Glycosyltransferase family 2 protein n=1 Tax=Streptomyces citrinus TaxID=3118173 RepID=A0ACD5AFW7_9ACTN
MQATANPRLSVIVPVYNVELYLDECLRSLAAQTFTAFEVVMVDDGSADGSAAIAAEWAARDPRFRLISQPNRGLGAARNTGVRAMDPRAEYLAFVDSDDTLPPNAYELLIETLDETGSDFAAGNVTRFRSAGHVQSPVHRTPFATTRLRTHISSFRPLLTDRTAWNKVYRRAFWERHALAYPEGMLYEDAPVSIPAHYLADSVDVLSEPIYHWREREIGERSITQNRTDPRGLTDRVRSIRMVRDFLSERIGSDPMYADHLAVYDRNALYEEMPLFWKVLPGSDPAYRTAFLDQVGRLARDIGQDKVRALPVPHKLKIYLTVHRRVDELIALLEYEKKHGGSIPVAGVLRPRAAYPFLDAARPVPDSVLRLDHQELGLRSRLDTVTWDEDGKLRLSGWAFARQLGAETRGQSLKTLVLSEKGGRKKVVVPARSHYDPEATVASGAEFRHADWAGFTATVNPDRLRRRGRWTDGIWHVRIAVGGTRATPRRGPLHGARTGTGQTPPAHWVSPTSASPRRSRTASCTCAWRRHRPAPSKSVTRTATWSSAVCCVRRRRARPPCDCATARPGGCCSRRWTSGCRTRTAGCRSRPACGRRTCARPATTTSGCARHRPNARSPAGTPRSCSGPRTPSGPSVSPSCSTTARATAGPSSPTGSARCTRGARRAATSSSSTSPRSRWSSGSPPTRTAPSPSAAATRRPVPTPCA